MTKKKIQAYSPQTDTTYDSWDDLVEAEADGYVVIIVATNVNTGAVEFANVYKKAPTKQQARNKAAYGRRQGRERDAYNYKFFVRPNWK